MSFFVKACVEALESIPGRQRPHRRAATLSISTSITRRGGQHREGADGAGAARLRQLWTLPSIEKGIAGLAVKARDSKISVADLQGGTFTITNGGVFGSLLSTPILNPPQSAILGMHTIQKRPVVVDDQIVIRPMMYLALSYDHRMIDGREAVSFLVRVKECIENPERLLLEVYRP